MPTNEAAEPAAVTAAEKWLAWVDARDYAESWNQASALFKSGIRAASLFRSGVSQSQWQSSLAAVQTQVGKAVSRHLKSKQYTTELPDEPEGEYAVLKYQTSFERQKNGAETVILMKDQDGTWRVSGYRVVLGGRPAKPPPLGGDKRKEPSV